MNYETRASLLSHVGRLLFLIALVLAPMQWGLRLGGAHVSPADPLLMLSFGCWLAKIVVTRDWHGRFRLPWTMAAFTLVVLASVIVARDADAAIRESAQVVAYFVVGGLLATDLVSRHARTWRLMQRVLLGVAAGIVLLALVQYLTAADPLRVRGTFGNRNVLSGWLALALPVVCGVGLYSKEWFVRAGLLALVAMGLLVTLSGAVLTAVLAVCLLLAATRGWRTFALTGLAALLALALLAPRLGNFRDGATGEVLTHEQVLFRSVALYGPDGQPDRRYPEWQSAVEMMLTNPWLGVGIGNYQRHIGGFSGTKPDPTGPAEPDTQNLYLLIGASTGLTGLFCLVAMLWLPVWKTCQAAAAANGWCRGLALGVGAGLAAFACSSAWHPLLVRGIGLHLALLLVLAHELATPTDAGRDAR